MRWFLPMVALLIAAPAQAECEFPDDIQAKVKSWVEAGYSPGVVMAKIDSQGHVCYASSGLQSTGSPQKVDQNTIFEIGSISKVFTALALVRLQEQGKLKLSDKAQSHLPQAVLPQGSNREITLLDLAQHTSGLPRLPDNIPFTDPANPYADYTPSMLWNFLMKYQLPRPVGADYEYSNLGIGVLGQAISHRTNMSYAQWVQELVIQPLGLKETQLTLSDSQLPRFATGHSGNTPVQHWDFLTLGEAGALRSTATDLSSFLAQAMSVKSSALKSSFETSFKTLYQSKVPNLSIGLAWHVIGKDDKQIVMHDGGTGGFRSFIGFHPKSKTGYVVLANSSTFPATEFGLHLLDPEIPLPPLRKEISLTAEQKQLLLGRYDFAEIGLMAEVKLVDGVLIAGFVGQGDVILHAESATKFFLTEVDATLEFTFNAQGQVDGLTLNQAGQSFKGTRKK